MLRCAPEKHSPDLTGRTESTCMTNWKSKGDSKHCKTKGLCGILDDGEGNAVKRRLNKAKLLKLERHWKVGSWFKMIVITRKSALKSSRWNWASRKAKCSKQKRKISAQLQRGPQRKFKGNSSKKLGMKSSCAAIAKKSKKKANQIQTNKSRNGFKLPVKTHDLEIRRASVPEDENLKQFFNRCE